MFDLYRGPHWTLLRLFGTGDWPLLGKDGVTLVDVVAGRDGVVEGPAEVFVDSGGHVTDAYGGSGEYLLVRPDGYAGWIGTAAEIEDLQEYWGQVTGK